MHPLKAALQAGTRLVSGAKTVLTGWPEKLLISELVGGFAHLPRAKHVFLGGGVRSLKPERLEAQQSQISAEKLMCSVNVAGCNSNALRCVVFQLAQSNFRTSISALTRLKCKNR